MSLDNILHHAASLREAGRSAEAKSLLVNQLKMSPANDAILFRLGQSCIDTGALTEAESWLQQAVQAAPNKAVLHKTLADVRAELGKTTDAKASYQEAIALDPRYFNPHANLANILLDEGEIDTAIDHYLNAIKLRPDIAELFDSLGQAYDAKGVSYAARANFLQALKINPELAAAHYHLAENLQQEKLYDTACRHYRKAVALDNSESAIQAGLVRALLAMGHTDEAADAIRTLETQYGHVPSEVLLYLRAFLATQEQRFDEALQMWQTLAQLAGSDEGKLRTIQVRLAEMYDAMGDYPAAFEAINRAHQLNIPPMMPIEMHAWLDRLIAAYPAHKWGLLAKSAHRAPPQPIFIFGMPRSGKSLAEKLLATHPQVFGLDEQLTTSQLPLPNHITQQQLPRQEALKRLNAAELEQMATDFLEIAEEYLNDAGKSFHGGITHMTSATPANLVDLPLIHRLFPDAPLIHVKRHPLDTCTACFFTEFADGVHVYTYDLEQLATYYLLYQRLVAHWRDTLNIPMLEITYEDMINDPIGMRTRLWQYINIEELVDSAENHTAFPLTLSAAWIGHWQRYEAALKPLVDQLGDINPTTLQASGYLPPQ